MDNWPGSAHVGLQQPPPRRCSPVTYIAQGRYPMSGATTKHENLKAFRGPLQWKLAIQTLLPDAQIEKLPTSHSAGTVKDNSTQRVSTTHGIPNPFWENQEAPSMSTYLHAQYIRVMMFFLQSLASQGTPNWNTANCDDRHSASSLGPVRIDLKQVSLPVIPIKME
ncbi:hypothetical protein GQ43DRAFT_476622 [Delitschia confertaspora ATCC 74209]|uniref:Uncharacterized protein n=1 Tax=Delitschia confertaspora ATCC 74209 TaxID=1513339 RepID=A0A9P4JB87_9PLEO|nr:hypothetical protein GQ43DRAFT_476622 [Delitschia confertaspora ATCC 74209]